MTSVLDCPPEVLEKYMAATGKTREEIEESLAKLDEAIANSPDVVEAANPALKEKFTSDPGLVFIDKEDLVKR